MFIGIFKKSAHLSDFFVESGWIDWNIQNYIKTGPHFCPVCLTVLIQVEQISLNSIAPPSSIPIWIFSIDPHFCPVWIDAFCEFSQIHWHRLLKSPHFSIFFFQFANKEFKKTQTKSSFFNAFSQLVSTDWHIFLIFSAKKWFRENLATRKESRIRRGGERRVLFGGRELGSPLRPSKRVEFTEAA